MSLVAPELFTGDSEVSASCDIWSLGATVVELITGYPPFHGMEPMAAVFNLIEGRSPIPDNISVQLRSFLEGCFHLAPCSRPTAEQLLQHEWITTGSQGAPDPPSILSKALRTNRWAAARRVRPDSIKRRNTPPPGLITRSSASFNSMLKSLEEDQRQLRTCEPTILARGELESEVS